MPLLLAAAYVIITLIWRFIEYYDMIRFMIVSISFPAYVNTGKEMF